MALLDIDGFAHGNTNRYAVAGGGTFGLTATPRTPGGTYWAAAGTTANRRQFTAGAEIFHGFGWLSGATTTNHQICAFYGDAGATQHITLGLNVSGQLEVRRGNFGGTLIATGTTVFGLNTWVYIECRVVISDTVGVVQVRLNGSATNEINFTGDTKNAGTNSTIDGIGGPTRVASSNEFQSDLYVCDATGSVNNTWLGDVAVRTLIPNGDGNSSQLLGSDGNSVSNYQQVDDVPYNTTDYNGSATVGQKDTYALADLPAGVTAVYGVRVNGYFAKSDAGLASAKIVTRSGGTDYAPTTRTLTTSYLEFSEIRETDPATSAAWTPANVNALQVGMEVA